MGWVLTATSRLLYSRERDPVPNVQEAGGGGARPGMVGWGQSRPSPGFDPQTCQPVASHYTDCAVPVDYNGHYCRLFFSLVLGSLFVFKNIIPYQFLLFAKKLLKGCLETKHNYAKVRGMCSWAGGGGYGDGKPDKMNFRLSHRC
jgi:hypothetical protein